MLLRVAIHRNVILVILHDRESSAGFQRAAQLARCLRRIIQVMVNIQHQNEVG